MKIIGGSFGTSGTVSISQNESIHIEGAIRASKTKAEVKQVVAQSQKERGFGTLGFVLGAPMLCVAGWYIGGPMGVLVGLVLAIAGSFYGKKFSTAEVEFLSGERLSVRGSEQDINQLIRLRT